MMTYQKIRSIIFFLLIITSLSFATKKYVINFDTLNISFLTSKGTMNVNVLFSNSSSGNIYELGHISEIFFTYEEKK